MLHQRLHHSLPVVYARLLDTYLFTVLFVADVTGAPLKAASQTQLVVSADEPSASSYKWQQQLTCQAKYTAPSLHLELF